MNVEDYGAPRLTISGNVLGYTNTGLNLTAGVVNTVEMRIKTGTGNGDVDIWLNNTTEGSPNYNGSGTVALDALLAGLGYSPESGVSTTYYDDVIVNSSFIGAGTSPNSAPTAPASLLAEGQTNPTDVTDSTPEFSAIYSDTYTGTASADWSMAMTWFKLATGGTGSTTMYMIHTDHLGGSNGRSQGQRP